MIKTKAISIIFILIFLQFILSAQHLNYPVKKINGIEYYIYTVEVQEGLYSISKKFGVKQSEISDANPEVNDGLKAGQVLIIPKVSNTNKETNTSTNGSVKKSTGKVEFIEHLVLKKQTLFSIGRIYHIDIDSIKKYNPQIENNGLREGDTLRIPSANNTSNVKPTEKKTSGNIFDIFRKKSDKQKKVAKEEKSDSKYIFHKVKKKETLYSISKLYDVEIEDIIKLNPEAEFSIKIDTELKIPNKSYKGVDENKDDSKLSKQTNSDLSDKININENRTIKIAYLLPLMLEQTKVDANNEKFVDFYSGSLLAINEAKKRGISFEIYTFDTEKSETKMSDIINHPDLKKVDFIIGPAYPSQVAMIGDFARTNKINTLIPFTSKIFDIDTNSYLFQFNPGMNYELKFMIELLKTKYKNSRIIFAELTEVNASDGGYIFASSLKKELKKQNINFSEIEITNSESADLVYYLSTSENNLIISNTEKYTNINQFLSGLKTVSQTNEITYFKQVGWPDNDGSLKVKSFFISPFNNNPNKSDLEKYKIIFENNFNWSSSESTPSYDLLGYDLTKYFISQYIQKGVEFGTGVSKLPAANGIQSEFQFERLTKNSGFINNQLYSTEK